MGQIKARKTLYLNADRSAVVDDGSPDAAFLLVREGSAIDAADAERYGVQGAEVPVYDAKQDHFEKHGGMDPTRDAAGRARLLRGDDDPDGPAAPGERGNLQDASGDGPASGDVEQEPGTKALRRKGAK